jgi:hypothetical protein
MANSPNKCNGVVTGSLPGGLVMTTYTHEDGLVCYRPGPYGAIVGSLVESTFEVKFGLCEHEPIRVTPPKAAAAPAKPAVKPAGTIVHKVQPLAKIPAALSVQAILAAAERKNMPAPPRPARLASPKEDVMPDAETIARAAKPPKIKSDLSTAPAIAQAAAKIPFEDGVFDGDTSLLTPEEIRELSEGPRHEPISTGKPMNPFDSGFDAGRPSPEEAKAPRRKKGPVSVFDM